MKTPSGVLPASSGARDCSLLKLSHLLRQPAGKCKQLWERQIFSERHQMHFVVTRSPIASRTDQRGRVENFRSRSLPPRIAGVLPIAPVTTQLCVVARHLAHRLAKQRIVRKKRRRRFRPHDQINLAQLDSRWRH